jgi:hypothetical protein
MPLEVLHDHRSKIETEISEKPHKLKFSRHNIHRTETVSSIRYWLLDDSTRACSACRVAASAAVAAAFSSLFCK